MDDGAVAAYKGVVADALKLGRIKTNVDVDAWVGPEDEVVSRSLTDLFHYDGGNLKTYGRMVQSLDAAVGQVLAALDETGQGHNTLVIFTSDNGGERFSKTWPFTGQKTELLEGGLRVPTLLAAAGVASHPDYPSDGLDILPVLTGEHSPLPRTLYWRYKAQVQADRYAPERATRSV